MSILDTWLIWMYVYLFFDIIIGVLKLNTTSFKSNVIISVLQLKAASFGSNVAILCTIWLSRSLLTWFWVLSLFISFSSRCYMLAKYPVCLLVFVFRAALELRLCVLLWVRCDSMICLASCLYILYWFFLLQLHVLQFRQAKTEIVNASRVAYRFMAGLTSKNQASQESPGDQNRGGGPTFQGAWFKNVVSAGAKPSTSGSTPSQEADDAPPLQGQKSAEQSTRL